MAIRATVGEVYFPVTLVVTTTATPIRTLISTALALLTPKQVVPPIQIVQVNLTPVSAVTFQAMLDGSAVGDAGTLVGGVPVELIAETIGEAKLSCAAATVSVPAWVTMTNV
jgi:hypothetical protein